MRRRAWGLVGAGVAGVGLAVCLGLAWDTRSGAAPSSDSSAGASEGERKRPRAAPTPPPGGTLSIRGRVRDRQGPAAGVRVSATRPMPGETISELPCPVTPGEGEPSARNKSLPECMEEAGPQVLELVEVRYGEAPVHAETVTAADGSFVLDGLPEGAFTLWAQGEQGVELRPQVAAGAEGVELVLGEGIMLEGLVTDASEHPLAEVRLTLLYARHTRFFDARSGADGRFQVGPLPKGDYALVAQKEDWLPEFLPPELVQRRGTVVLHQPGRLVGRVQSSEGAPAPGAEVRLTAGGEAVQVTTSDAQGRFVFEGLKPLSYALSAQREGLYATAQALLRAMELTGEEVVLRLGESRYVEGTVRDDAGSPLEGASVRVWRMQDYGQNWRARTDAEGHYRVGPLLLSDYVFDVAAPRHLQLENEERKLTRELGTVDFALARAVSVSGTIVDEEGAPVTKAPLSLSNREGISPMGTESTALSGEDGRFVLDAPEAGPWFLTTSDERFLSAKLQVQVPSQEVRWVLRRGARIDGAVTDSTGEPLVGIWATVWKSGEEWTYQRSNPTDERGRFSVSGLEAGSYVVEATVMQEGVERMATSPVTLRDFGRAEVSLRFESGWSVSGLVVDEAGQPMGEVAINPSQPFSAAPPWRQSRGGCGSELPRIVTGRDGRFTLQHLTGEAYELWAYKEGYSFVPAKSAGGEPIEGNQLRVRSGTEQVRLVLESQARIQGRLVGPEGAPIPRFEVNRRFTSDARGAFSTPIQETGTQELYFDAPGMAQLHLNVEVREGVGVELGEVRMDPGRRIEGRVVDAETGEPVAGAQLMLMERLGGRADSLYAGVLVAETREDGTFSLPHVEARPFELQVSHVNYRLGRVALGTGHESLAVKLEAGALVEVSVRDPAGRPLDADVRLLREEDNRWENLGVLKGLGRRRGLEPGAYRVQVSTSGENPAVFLPQRVTVPARGQVALAFVPRTQGATLALRMEGNEEVLEAILVPSAPPALPVTMETIPRWGIHGLSPQEDQGVRRFSSLPPGRVTLLLVRASGPPQFHLEELELPAEGVLEHVVRPKWQPLPER